MVNGSGSAESVTNGGYYENSSPVARCTLSKMLEAGASNAAIMVTWPPSNKHRRGDPVKVSSYVKRQSTPVSATISVKQRIPRMSPRVDRIESLLLLFQSDFESRMSGTRYEFRRRNSAPPSTRASDFDARRCTASAPPICVGNDCDPYLFCLSPSMNT
ncbi:hypothetical protein OSTOST_00964, partial [Ostertagia ostertagi]